MADPGDTAPCSRTAALEAAVLGNTDCLGETAHKQAVLGDPYLVQERPHQGQTFLVTQIFESIRLRMADPNTDLRARTAASEAAVPGGTDL